MSDGCDVNLQDIEVIYSEPNGAVAWAQRRSEAEAPDVWPYGLNRLTDHFDSVRPVDLRRLAPHDLLSLFLRRCRPTLPATCVSLAWDERAAMRMVHRGTAERMFSGIIWATDAAVRGEDRFRTALSKRCLSRLDGIWCLSRAQLGPTSDWLGIDSSRIHYLRFGVDCDFFSYVAYPKGRPTIVSFGNDRDRDSKTLLSALDLIISRNPEVRAIVQTDSDLPLPNGVIKIDRVAHRQVHQIYGESSLVLVATKNNLHASGMTVALEAMSTGRPVVVTGTPGMQDYVKDGVSGFLAEEGEPESLASAALKIIDSPRVGEVMGLAGRRAVEASFNTTMMARRIAAIVSDVKRH